MAALSAPPPASAPADDAFHISLYQFVHDGMRKCGVPPVPLGEAYLSAAATTADFITQVVAVARRASTAATSGAADAAGAAVSADFDIPPEMIGCGALVQMYSQKNFRMWKFKARKQGLTDATSTQPCSEYFGPDKTDIVIVLCPGATPGITYDRDKDPTLKKPGKKPGEPGGPPPLDYLRPRGHPPPPSSGGRPPPLDQLRPRGQHPPTTAYCKI